MEDMLESFIEDYSMFMGILPHDFMLVKEYQDAKAGFTAKVRQEYHPQLGFQNPLLKTAYSMYQTGYNACLNKQLRKD